MRLLALVVGRPLPFHLPAPQGITSECRVTANGTPPLLPDGFGGNLVDTPSVMVGLSRVKPNLCVGTLLTPPYDLVVSYRLSYKSYERVLYDR